MQTYISPLNWYQSFNLLEAILWWIVASTIALKSLRESTQQKFAVLLAVLAFIAFGVSDLLEAQVQGAIPLWLWGLKTLCGTAILASRITWKGWITFRWTDREFLFGCGCLLAVVVMIVLQSTVFTERH